MRRIKILLTGVVLLFSVLPTSADEGMWLLPLLEKMNIKSMQQLGCRLSADEIYNINNSLKDAVVVFGGGCTAEVVSDKGLILTNYHCGHSNIQKLSSVDHNYLQDGYWAMTLSEELPAEGLYVTFLESFTDVTDKVVKASKRAKTLEAADAAIKKVSAELSAAAKGNNQYLNANVVSMYGGNAYYLIVTKRFNDIRFVGAPPTSIGKFGADTDNWMWPRHTCDFSMFRIYADKNGNPAPYSPDNVPYTPKRSLEISLKGVAPGDFSMIIGYPGSTNRFMTSAELVETRDISNAISIQCRTIRQELLMEDMVADDAVRLQYAAKFNSSSNGWKKSRGMNETFGKLKVAERRAADEAAFTNWVNQKKSRKKAYGTALEKVNHAVTTRAAARKVNTYLTETLNRVELASIAYSTYTTMTENAKAGKMEAKGVEAMSKRLDNFYKDYSVETDRKVTKAMIKTYRDNLTKGDLPDFYKTIEKDFNNDIDAYVDYMFDNSAFTSKAKLLSTVEKEYFTSEADADKISNVFESDPAVQFAISYRKLAKTLSDQINSVSREFSQGKKEYIAGTLAMREGEAIYPDANSTMRLTYGTIQPYSPKDAVVYDYYTTLKGVMEKEDPDNWEFVVPEKLKELYATKDFGRYARADGELPACFIMTGDITGGNSGSPVMDADGRLTGLAFDGNWEAMSGDIIFEPDLQRCICVDIRYVLFIIDKYGNAKHLIDEMKIVE